MASNWRKIFFGDQPVSDAEVSRIIVVVGNALFLPLCAALTAQSHGPEMDDIWQLLGEERVRRRLWRWPCVRNKSRRAVPCRLICLVFID
jgi:hypothetical protein